MSTDGVEQRAAAAPRGVARRLRRRWTRAIVGLLMLFGIRPETAPNRRYASEFTPVLVGYRVLYDVPDVGKVFELDADVEPAIRVSHTRKGVLESALSWSTGARTEPLDFSKEAHGDDIFHVIDDVGALEHAEELHLTVNEPNESRHQTYSWRVRWAPAHPTDDEHRRPLASEPPSVQLSRSKARVRATIASGEPPLKIAAAWHEAAAVAKRVHATSEQADRLSTAAHFYIIAGRLREARDSLDRAQSLSHDVGHERGKWLVEYYRSQLALRRGDLEAASKQLTDVGETLRKVRLDSRLPWVRIDQALVQVAAGHVEVARQLLGGLDGDPELTSDGALRTHFYSARAWVLLCAMSSGDIPADYGQIRQLLEENVLPGRIASGNDVQLANDLANLAYADLLMEDDEALSARLAELERIREQAYVEPFVDLLRGERALRHGTPELALAHFEAALRASESGSDHRWRASIGMGRASERLSRTDDAIRHYVAGLRALHAVAVRSPLPEGRGVFWAHRRRYLADLPARLVALARPWEALAVADFLGSATLQSNATAVRLAAMTVAEEEEWNRSVQKYLSARVGCEPPKVVRPGDVSHEKERRAKDDCHADAERAYAALHAWLDETVGVAAFDPTAARRIADRLGPREAILLGYQEHVFVARRDGDVSVHVASDREGWIAALDGVDRVHAVGPAADAALYGSGWSGLIPLERFAIASVPFLTTLERDSTEGSGPPLVVVDPSKDLKEALDEVTGWAQDRAIPTLSGEGASRSAVLAALPGAGLFFFTGHAVAPSRDEWSGYLVLADGRLEARDLLAARSRARLAILNACESAADGRGERLGVAEALLLSGVRGVLAPVRVVGESEARRFVRTFLKEGGLENPSEAYRTTALRLRGMGDPIWDAYRMLGET